MPMCMMCGMQKRDARNRAGKRAKARKVRCDECEARTLASVRARGADDAARALLARLDEEHEGNLSAIARDTGAERVHVRQYMRRYGIGRYARAT
jgi:transcriptional regulator of acetoin/glycerol metabolism